MSTREERFIEMLGGLDEKLTAMAMPGTSGYDFRTEVHHVSFETAGPDISGLKRYTALRAAALSAAAVLLIGGGILFWINRDKIGMKNPLQDPAVSASVTSTEPKTPDMVIQPTVETDRYEQKTDTSMPEYPFGTDDTDHYEIEQWEVRFYNTGIFGKPENPGILENIRTSDNETPYKLDDDINLYSVSQALGLTADEIRSAMLESNSLIEQRVNTNGLLFGDDDISIMCEDDREWIANQFKNPYSVIVGDNVFSPWWLYWHTPADYEACGITVAQIEMIMPAYMENPFGMTEEAIEALGSKFELFISSRRTSDESRRFYLDSEAMFDDPLGVRAMKIFDNVFFGTWTFADRVITENMPEAVVTMTYTESSQFDLAGFQHPTSIFETDDLYVMTYIAGGEGSAYVVEKSQPEIMYWTGIEYFNGWNDTPAVDLSTGAVYSGHTIGEMPVLRDGTEISWFGERSLLNKLGKDFELFYNETLNSGFTDENGTEWWIQSSMALARDKRYLISGSDYFNSTDVTLGIQYYVKPQYDKFSDTLSEEDHPESRFFAANFRKDDSGEWSVSYRPMEEVFTFGGMEEITGDKSGARYAAITLYDVKHIGSTLTFPNADVQICDTATETIIASAHFSTPFVGLDDYSFPDSGMELRLDEAKGGCALITLKIPDDPHNYNLYWFDGKNLHTLMAGSQDCGISSIDDIVFEPEGYIHITDTEGTEHLYTVVMSMSGELPQLYDLIGNGGVRVSEPENLPAVGIEARAEKDIPIDMVIVEAQGEDVTTNYNGGELFNNEYVQLADGYVYRSPTNHNFSEVEIAEAVSTYNSDEADKVVDGLLTKGRGKGETAYAQVFDIMLTVPQKDTSYIRLDDDMVLQIQTDSYGTKYFHIFRKDEEMTKYRRLVETVRGASAYGLDVDVTGLILLVQINYDETGFHPDITYTVEIAAEYEDYKKLESLLLQWGFSKDMFMQAYFMNGAENLFWQ